MWGNVKKIVKLSVPCMGVSTVRLLSDDGILHSISKRLISKDYQPVYKCLLTNV